MLSNLVCGDIVDAKITHLESFGAFCDIGCGNVALLPIDAISVSRISHPKDRFCVGNNIKAVIKSISDDGKITLSHKELLGTWEENACKFSAGQTVTGVIRSVENYGIFVEITPNLAGLAEPKENVKVGQQASVYIKSILRDKMKIKLIIIDSFDVSYSPEIKYFIPENRIDEWDYSPKNCYKQITTKFCG
jgi:small subunit ribosomal protein S1